MLVGDGLSQEDLRVMRDARWATRAAMLIYTVQTLARRGGGGGALGAVDRRACKPWSMVHGCWASARARQAPATSSDYKCAICLASGLRLMRAMVEGGRVSGVEE